MRKIEREEGKKGEGYTNEEWQRKQRLKLQEKKEGRGNEDKLRKNLKFFIM